MSQEKVKLTKEQRKEITEKIGDFFIDMLPESVRQALTDDSDDEVEIDKDFSNLSTLKTAFKNSIFQEASERGDFAKQYIEPQLKKKVDTYIIGKTKSIAKLLRTRYQLKEADTDGLDLKALTELAIKLEGSKSNDAGNSEAAKAFEKKIVELSNQIENYEKSYIQLDKYNDLQGKFNSYIKEEKIKSVIAPIYDKCTDAGKLSAKEFLISKLNDTLNLKVVEDESGSSELKVYMKGSDQYKPILDDKPNDNLLDHAEAIAKTYGWISKSNGDKGTPASKTNIRTYIQTGDKGQNQEEPKVEALQKFNKKLDMQKMLKDLGL